jgi:DeoR family fructose operon transcriptional repressor
MLTQDRREQILEILKQNGSVEVSSLSAMLNASESTIRRDIAALSNVGKLNKVHGGATLLHQEFFQLEDSLEAKSHINADEKEVIANYAAGLINDNDFVFIDAGSTTFQMIKHIEGTKASFVTNGIAHAKELARRGLKVTILGGEIKDTTDAVIGIEAATGLQKYNFSKAFLGANGVSERQGFTTPDCEEGILKAIAIEKSFVSYILCDSTKFNRVSGYSFSILDKSCIITTKCADDKIKNKTVVKEVL